MKKVLHAHIEREIMFDTKEALENYMNDLSWKKKNIIVVSLREENDNYILRFKERYNKAPFFPEDLQKEVSR